MPADSLDERPLPEKVGCTTMLLVGTLTIAGTILAVSMLASLSIEAVIWIRAHF